MDVHRKTAERVKWASFPGDILGNLTALVGDQFCRGVLLERFSQAALTIHTRLASDPLGFGELTSSLTSLRLLMHVAFARPLMVEFGVHMNEKVVFVRRFESVTSLQ